MKKFWLVMIGIIAGIVLLIHIGPMIALALSLVLLYYGCKKFLKAETNQAKVGWGLFGVIVFIATVANLPAIIGAGAAYVLYLIYNNWNKTKSTEKEEHDPFINFEKQWADLKK